MIRGAAALFIVALALTAPWYGCARRATDEELVRAAVIGAVKAVEERDVSAFMGFVSRDYDDADGNDFDAVKGMAFHQFMRGKPLRVFIRGMDIEVKGDLAAVDARVVAIRGVATLKDALPEEADAMRFNVVMRKEGAAWRALRASWASIGAAGLL
jgi:hypothetical protein